MLAMNVEPTSDPTPSVPDPYLAVRIAVTRFVSEETQPGMVECELVDAHGRRWVFLEKTACISSDFLWSDTAYPQPGVIACDILAEWTDGSGRRFARIDTNPYWGVRSVDDEHVFEVITSQICWVTRSTGKELRPYE